MYKETYFYMALHKKTLKNEQNKGRISDYEIKKINCSGNGISDGFIHDGMW